RRETAVFDGGSRRRWRGAGGGAFRAAGGAAFGGGEGGLALLAADGTVASVGGGRVREPNVLELDPARAVGREVERVLRVANVRLGVEEPEDALGGRHRALEHVVLLRQVLDRTEEAPRVLQECGDHADGDRAAEDAGAPVDDDEGKGDGGPELD